jgi:hypothetical protein
MSPTGRWATYSSAALLDPRSFQVVTACVPKCKRMRACGLPLPLSCRSLLCSASSFQAHEWPGGLAAAESFPNGIISMVLQVELSGCVLLDRPNSQGHVNVPETPPTLKNYTPDHPPSPPTSTPTHLAVYLRLRHPCHPVYCACP